MQEYTISPISLRIAGTKVRKSGFNSLCTVGVPPENEKQGMDRSTLVKSDPSFVFKHTPDYVFYMVVDRRVKPVGTDADGVLSIAVNFPANKMLADGKSPYTLLMELYEAFRQNYMRPMADGRYAFIDTYVESTAFEQILQRYALTDQTLRYVPMVPDGLTAQLQVPTALMPVFLSDTQYPEFARFKDVEVGEDCMTTPGLENLEIPRPVKYEVWENNVNTGKLIKSTDYYTTSVADTPYETFRNVTFSIAEIPEGGVLKRDGATIQFDVKAGRVNCIVSSEAVTYTLRLLISGSCTQEEKDLLKSKIANNEITFKLNNWENINEALLKGLKIRARDAVNARVSNMPLKLGRFHLFTEVKVDDVRREMLVILNANEEKANVVGTTGAAGVADTQHASATNKPSGGTASHSGASPKPQKKNNMLYMILAGVIGFAIAVLLMLLLFDNSPEVGPVSQRTTSDTTKVPTAKGDTTKQETEPQTTTATTKGDLDTTTHEELSEEGEGGPSNPDQSQLDKDNKAKKAEKALETPSVNIDQVKQKVVDLIRSGKTLNDVQKVTGYNSLDFTDKVSVEAILRPEQYTNPGEKSPYKKPDKVGLGNVTKAVSKKSYIKTWADLIAIQNEITRIMNKFVKK